MVKIYEDCVRRHATPWDWLEEYLNYYRNSGMTAARRRQLVDKLSEYTILLSELVNGVDNA